MGKINNGRASNTPWAYLKGLPQRLLDSLIVAAILGIMAAGATWISQGHLVELLGGVRSEGAEFELLKKRVCNLEGEVDHEGRHPECDEDS